MYVRCLLLAVPLWLFPSLVFAHAVGQSFEKRIGPYLLDAGCDQIEFSPGVQNICSFGLIGNPDDWDWKLAQYDSVFVKVEDQASRKAVHEETMEAKDGLLSFTIFTFPTEGSYSMQLRFSSGGAILAEESFPLQVGKGIGSTRLGLYVSMGILALFPLILLGHTLKDRIRTR